MASIDEVSFAIGELRGQSATLIRASREHAVETKMIRLQLQDVLDELKSVKSDVTEMKPVVGRVKKWEQRAIGLSLLGGLSGIGGLIAWFRGI